MRDDIFPNQDEIEGNERNTSQENSEQKFYKYAN